jgi:hypothetical protein
LFYAQKEAVETIIFLTEAIRPNTEAGEAPEVPGLDRDRPCATANISMFPAKRVREAVCSHVNLVIVDSI